MNHTIHCVNCGGKNFEDDICQSCGCFFEETETSHAQPYIGKRDHIRCDKVESACERRQRQYALQLTHWSDEDKLRLNEYICGRFEEMKEDDVTLYGREILVVGLTLKFAMDNKIPCNIHDHIKGLNVKRFGKALSYLKVGLISEGLCDERVAKYIALCGDAGNVRPMYHVESPSKSPMEYSQHYYVPDSSLKMILDALGCKDTNVYERAHDIAHSLMENTNIIQEEGEMNMALLSVFRAVEITYAKFCKTTRLTSVPTLTRLYKKYDGNIIGY